MRCLWLTSRTTRYKLEMKTFTRLIAFLLYGVSFLSSACCNLKPSVPERAVIDMSQLMTAEMHLRNHYGNPDCTANRCEWHASWQELSDCWVCRIGMPLSTPNPKAVLIISPEWPNNQVLSQNSTNQVKVKP